MQLEASSSLAPNVSCSSPDFFRWSFGEGGEQNPVKAQSCELKIHWNLSAGPSEKSFREEVYAAAEKMAKRLHNRKIALFHGGGRKSEILLRVFAELELPMEIFFLDYWGLNSSWNSDWVEPVAKKFGIPIHTVQLEKVKFFQFAKKQFLQFGIEGPNALAMAFLAESISEEFFPVVGAGSLDRVGSLYRAIGDQNPVPKSGMFLPFSSVHVFPYLWSRSSRRNGEFAFFQSDETLFRSALAGVRWEHPYLDLTEVYQGAFPLVAQRPTSTNWDGEIGQRENFLFRKSLEFIGQCKPEFSFWKKAAGCSVAMDVFGS